MPNGDKTGPEGKGPKTGRGLGDCTDNDKLIYTTDNRLRIGQRNYAGRGQGLGRRQGLGRGFRRRNID